MNDVLRTVSTELGALIKRGSHIFFVGILDGLSTVLLNMLRLNKTFFQCTFHLKMKLTGDLITNEFLLSFKVLRIYISHCTEQELHSFTQKSLFHIFSRVWITSARGHICSIQQATFGPSSIGVFNLFGSLYPQWSVKKAGVP